MELLKRVGSAAVFLPLFVLLVARGPRWGFALLVIVIALLAMGEFCRMVRAAGHDVNRPLALCLGAALVIAFVVPWPWFLPLILSAGVGSLLTAGIVSRSSGPGSNEPVGAALALLGAMYVSWPLGHSLWLLSLSHGVQLVLLLVLITWGSDASAYLVGATLGRRPLCPMISPKKTVEGAFGGLAGAIVAALIGRAWFYGDLALSHALTLGVLLGIFGLLGDLSESVMKRAGGIKDTGGLIPGHGGVLDRIDSLLFTTPALYYYARLGLGE